MKGAAPVVKADEPECPGPNCPMCAGECCALCGAGCWAPPGSVHCEHDVIDRHREPDEQAPVVNCWRCGETGWAPHTCEGCHVAACSACSDYHCDLCGVEVCDGCSTPRLDGKWGSLCPTCYRGLLHDPLFIPEPNGRR